MASDEAYFVVGRVYPETPDGNLHDEDSLRDRSREHEKGFSETYRLATISDWKKVAHYDILFTEVTFDLYLKAIEE